MFPISGLLPTVPALRLGGGRRWPVPGYAPRRQVARACAPALLARAAAEWLTLARRALGPARRVAGHRRAARAGVRRSR
jgi:hypothetical protein